MFFTLFLGALAIYAYQLLQKRFPRRTWIPFLLVFLLVLIAAGFVNCDYGVAGVLLIVCLYLAKTKQSKMLVIALWSLWLYLLDPAFNGRSFIWKWGNMGYVLGAAAACVPVLLYNGRRGKSWKWFFYIFYPAHLAVLLLIRFLILSGV